MSITVPLEVSFRSLCRAGLGGLFLITAACAPLHGGAGSGLSLQKGAGFALTALRAPEGAQQMGRTVVVRSGSWTHPAAKRATKISLPPPATGTLTCLGGLQTTMTVTVVGHGAHPEHCRGLLLRWGAAGLPPAILRMQGARFGVIPAGASAGAQLQVVGASKGETFRAVRVAAAGRRLVIWARLTGLATGVYRMIVEGRRSVRVRVRTTLVFRRPPLPGFEGPALVSFYDYGVANPMPLKALYPARHASDGLLVDTGRGPVWMPLRNPETAFFVQAVTGFVRGWGLLQRNRSAHDYGDTQARYADAANLWLRPRKAQRGRVTLLAEPLGATGPDNVKVLFIPSSPVTIGRPITERYDLIWQRKDPPEGNRARVVSTLIGGDAKTGARKYVIDYARGALPPPTAQHKPRGRVRVTPDTFVTQDTVGYNPYTRGWRQVIQVQPIPGQRLSIQAWLGGLHRPLSELWEYTLDAPRISR